MNRLLSDPFGENEDLFFLAPYEKYRRCDKNTTFVNPNRPFFIHTIMIRQLLSAAILWMLLAGATCERPVDLEIPLPEPELVIISTFSPQQPFRATLSSTRPSLPPTPTTFIADAQVVLFQSDNFIENLLPATGVLTPYYEAFESVPSEETTYTLRVSAPGYKDVIAQDVVPRGVAIRDIESIPLGFSPGANADEIVYHYNIRITFDDPAAFRNYYHLRFHQEILRVLISEAGDTITIGKRRDQIGFGSAINNNTITAYLDDGVLFEDNTFNGRRVTFSFPFEANVLINRELPGHLFVELRAVSEAYYRFYSTVGRQQNSPGAPYSEPVIVFSNVEGGKGIFAGFNADIDSIRISR